MMRWPFMLRSTHERILEKEIITLIASNEALLLREDALVERVVQEVAALDRRTPAQIAAEYFPAPAPDPVPEKVQGSAAKLEPVETRQLTGPEVVQRAMNHRNLHKRSN